MARLIPSSTASWLLPCLLGAWLSGCLGGKRETGDLSEDPTGDRTDPIVLFSAPTSGETVRGVVAWSATASDDVGVVDVALRVDGEKIEVDDAEPWEGSWDATALSNGTHSLEVVAEDAAGNRGTNSIDVVVDNEGGLDPDAIVITNPTDGASVCGEVEVQTTASAEVVSVVFSLNGTAQETDTEAPFAWTWDTTTSPDTTVTISATASNAEGGTAVASVAVSVLNEDAACDNAPSVVFASPLDGDVVRGAVDVSVSALDDVAVASVSFYVDSGTLLTDTSVPYQTALDTTVFSDGVHVLKAIATDSAGQTSAAEIYFTIDNEAPVVTIDTPAEGETLEGTVTFTAEATDNLGLETVTLAVDGDTLGDFAAGPYTVALDTTALSYGAHTLSATATDVAGNETTEAVEVTVDNPPIVTFDEPVDTTIYGVASVVATATDDERVVDTTLTQDGVTVDTSVGGTPVSTTIDTCDLAHGETVEVEATATDARGNAGSASLLLTVDQLLQVGIDRMKLPRGATPPSSEVFMPRHSPASSVSSPPPPAEPRPRTGRSRPAPVGPTARPTPGGTAVTVLPSLSSGGFADPGRGERVARQPRTGKECGEGIRAEKTESVQVQRSKQAAPPHKEEANMLHIGMDVHKENTVWHAIDGTGQERGRGELPTRAEPLGIFLRDHVEQAKFYFEAGTASAWLYRLVAEAGHQPIVVDPNRNRAIATSSKKTDKHDAATLATLGRAHLYEPVYVRSEETDARRRTLTARSSLVAARADIIRVVRAFFRGEARPLPHADTDDFAHMVRTRAAMSPALESVVTPMLCTLDTLSAQIGAFDAEVHEIALTESATIKRLTAIPGVGENIAVSFLLYIEDPARFATKSQVSAALGLVPMVRESAGKRQEGGITKRGKKSMRKLLIQGAWAHLRSKEDTAIKRWAQNLVQRGNSRKKKQATVALARKMAELMWMLWLRGTDYQPFPRQSRRSVEPTPT